MQEDEVKMQSTEVFRARSSLRLPNEISEHDQHQDEMHFNAGLSRGSVATTVPNSIRVST